jgi:hypothetical protein
MGKIDPPQLGATGRFPRGKLTADDEGELRFVVAHKPGKVVIDFGRSVAWIALDPADVRQLAEVLLRQAALAEGGQP